MCFYGVCVFLYVFFVIGTIIAGSFLNAAVVVSTIFVLTLIFVALFYFEQRPIVQKAMEGIPRVY